MSPTTNLDSIKKPIKKTKAYKAIGKNINYRSVKGYPNTQNIAVNLAAQVFLAYCPEASRLYLLRSA